MTTSKYRNHRVEVGSLKFDSKLEQRRHAELLLLQRAGEIRDLRVQVRYELAPAVRYEGAKRLTPALCYWADAVYFDVRKGCEIIEDTKSEGTKDVRVYLMKKHLMKALLGLDIFEAKPR